MEQFMQKAMEYLAQEDPEIAALTQLECERQQRNLELIASENLVSPAVLAAMGTVLTNKYAEGLPGRRYYGGCEYVDCVEELAIARAKRLFGAQFANVQPHSGVQANMAVYAALLQPGDRILGMDLANGGHLSHGARVSQSGRYYESHGYGVDPETGRIDFDRVETLLKTLRPKLLICGASAYPRALDFKTFAELGHRYGAYVMADIAHISGLVAGGAHESPVPYCDVVTTTTHKTLRGPRGGLILSRDEALGKRLNAAVFPGTQGGPLMHTIAAKAVCFREAMTPDFRQYAEHTVRNAQALAQAFLRRGYDLVSGGTDNHLLLLDLRRFGITGKELQERLDAVYITVNKNAIPNDPQKPGLTSGVRIGTPAVTTRGLREQEMDTIADCIDLAVRDYAASADEIRRTVAQLTAQHPVY